jgi:hypothetical protein
MGDGGWGMGLGKWGSGEVGKWGEKKLTPEFCLGDY